LLRRLRAVLSIAFLWIIAWLPIGLALAVYASSRQPQPSDVLHRPVSVPPFVAACTVWGGLSGAVFALVLGAAERRTTIDRLSSRRTAVWGAVGAMTLPLILVLIDLASTPIGLRGYTWRLPTLVLSVSAAMGACCASATLALARGKGS